MIFSPLNIFVNGKVIKFFFLAIFSKNILLPCTVVEQRNQAVDVNLYQLVDLRNHRLV